MITSNWIYCRHFPSLRNRGLLGLLAGLALPVFVWMAIPCQGRAQTVTFPDPNLDALIHNVLWKQADEPITVDDMLTLTNLYPSYAAIRDTRGLEAARNLEMLDLSGNSITNFDGLSGLMNLTWLSVWNCEIADLSFLAAVPNLQTFYPGRNPITNATALAGLTRLTTLDLEMEEGFITNFFVPLASLSILTNLNMSSNPLQDVSAVSGLTNLVELHLAWGTNLADLGPVSGLGNLRLLQLDGNRISDLSPLSGLRNLRNLTLENNSLINLAPLAGLTNLEVLSVRFNQVSDLAPLGNLWSLIELGISSNLVQDISPICTLPNLQNLRCSWNSVTNLPLVANLHTLKSFSCERAGLSSAGFVSALTNLTVLDLIGSSLSDLAPLAGLTRLSNLLLDNNSITNIQPLAGLTNLFQLNLSDNHLVSLLDVWTNYPQLYYLTVQGNNLNLDPGSPDLDIINFLLARGASVTYLPQHPPLFRIVSQPAPQSVEVGGTVVLTATVSNSLPWLNYQWQFNGSSSYQAEQSTNSANPVLTLTLENVQPDQAGDYRLKLRGTYQGADLFLWSEVAHLTVLPSTVVNFPDPNLGAAVRAALSLPSAPLHTSDLLNLTNLQARSSGIRDTRGLESALNLQSLWLGDNPLTNCSGLSGLTNLVYLDVSLCGLGNLDFAATLPSLITLDASDNQITNATGLAGSRSLSTLSLGSNQIEDLSWAAGLTNLGALYAAYNHISDLSPLVGLPWLAQLDASFNSLFDLPAGLVSLRAGGVFYVQGNYLDVSPGSADMAVIDALLASGEYLTYLPQNPQPFEVMVQPTNLTVWAGEPAAFSVTVTSSVPVLGCQWQLNGGQWVGSEESWGPGTFTIDLTIDSAQALNAGSYRLRMRTSVGSVEVVRWSQGAALTVQGGTPPLVLTTGGDADWFTQTDSTHTPPEAWQSGWITGGQQSWLQTTVTGPGTLSFWWMISCEQDLEWIDLEVDGVSTNHLSGYHWWSQQFLDLGPGAHTLTWRFAEDPSVVWYGDAAWVDDLVFTPASAGAVHFTDPSLEAAVRQALQIPSADLTPADMVHLTTLPAVWAGITNLAGLEWAFNLTTLDLHANPLADITPLGSLTNLTSLGLDFNQISELSPLTNLTLLTSLNLQGDPVTDLSPLARLSSLTDLTLHNTLITDASLASLTNLVNLRNLGLGQDGLANVSVLGALTNLQYLDLEWNQVSDVSFAARMASLSSLSFHGNPVSDASPLAGNWNLWSLDLGNTLIEDISFMSGLTNLSGLYLGQTPLTNAAPIANAPGLWALDLSDTHVNDLSFLGSLANLHYLTLDGIPFSSLQPLAGAFTLAGLSLQRTGAHDISLLAGLTNLNWVNLNDNHLQDISVLAGLSNLYYVGLAQNDLDLSPGSSAMGVISTLQARGAYVDFSSQHELPPLLSAPQRLADGQFRFSLRTGPGTAFHLLVSSNLVDWDTLGYYTNASGNDTFTVPAPGTPAAFFRAVVP